MAKKPEIKKYNLEFNGNLTDRSVTNYIVIHHTGVDVDQSAETIHRIHVNDRGWLGIGYNYLIRPDGTIEEGRGLNARGAHARGVNSESIGISLVGNFNENEPTPEQIESLAYLIAWIKDEYGDLSVTGHTDHGNTACPGANFSWYELGEELDEIENGSEEVDDVTILINGREVSGIDAMINENNRTVVKLSGKWVELRDWVEMIPDASIDWDGSTRVVDVKIQ